MDNPTPRRGELAAGWLSVAAGAIHGGVAQQHFEEWWGYGAFFVAAGLCQTLFGLLLLTHGIESPRLGWERARRPLLVAGIAGNLAILALWLVTRTVGIPWFGPEAGRVEPVGATDAASKIVEIVLVILLFLLWRAPAVKHKA
ncbi:MAG: hypothetical protein QOG31_247 [Thermoplasmata archaeon]|jgi:hypothetical protein|nr:hypothetical protein [Thermoplasmata archaeon]